MFGNLFAGATASPAYRTGQSLFQQAVKAAIQYRTAEAIDLYTRSFEAEPNPAPLVNRAKLYRWRLMFEEAIRDLELAQRLDAQQGDEFAIPIGTELRECRFLAQHRFDGKRELFIADLKEKGHDYVAGRLADTIFKGEGALLGYHVINEIDTVKKFEDIADFPFIGRLLRRELSDQNMLDRILADPDGQSAFEETGMTFQAMLCVYDYADMAQLRDLMVKKIWTIMNGPH